MLLMRSLCTARRRNSPSGSASVQSSTPKSAPRASKGPPGLLGHVGSDFPQSVDDDHQGGNDLPEGALAARFDSDLRAAPARGAGRRDATRCHGLLLSTQSNAAAFTRCSAAQASSRAAAHTQAGRNLLVADAPTLLTGCSRPRSLRLSLSLSLCAAHTGRLLWSQLPAIAWDQQRARCS